MGRRSGKTKKAPAAHTRGVLRDRSASWAPSEGVKHVRIRSPTLIGLPPSLNDIVGEASPERAKQTIETRCSSSIPFPGLQSSINSSKRVLEQVPALQEGRDSEITASSTISTTASSYTESDEEDSMAMFIVGECEDGAAPPSLSGAHSSSESSVTAPAPRHDGSSALSRAASSAMYSDEDTDEETLSVDLIVGEVTGDKDLSQPRRSVSIGDESSQSGSGSHTPSHQHSTFIIGEVDINDNFLVDWESQSEDEGTPVSSRGADSDASSPDIAMLIVGEADDGDLVESPPHSFTSQSDRGMHDSNTRARDALTLTPVLGADDATIEDLSFDFLVEASSSSPTHPASPVSTQRNSSPPDSANPSSSYIDVKVNTAHHLSQLRSERQEVADALEEISNAEETALALQSSAFSTHPHQQKAESIAVLPSYYI